MQIEGHLEAYDASITRTNYDLSTYETLGDLWDHILCQINNHRTVAVLVRAEGIEYHIFFSGRFKHIPAPGFHERRRSLVK